MIHPNGLALSHRGEINNLNSILRKVIKVLCNIRNCLVPNDFMQEKAVPTRLCQSQTAWNWSEPLSFYQDRIFLS
jgi:hypothetical protein